MYPSNLNELRREAEQITDLDAKELFLWKSFVTHQQEVEFANDYSRQIESEIFYI
jgi:hypothetical protein